MSEVNDAITQYHSAKNIPQILNSIIITVFDIMMLRKRTTLNKLTHYGGLAYVKIH